MNTTTRKLLIAAVALLLSVIMVVTISYAWVTLSTTPTAEGMQITIGGGYTIMVAPDLTATVDGQTVHYPGVFDSTLRFSQYEEYAYLSQVNALTPVSTADGINWFASSYYGVSDPEVLSGQATVGSVKPISDFKKDTSLALANLVGDEQADGHYVYLDFWVVSPGSDYYLRVSQGDQRGGSYLLDLMLPTQTADGYTLTQLVGSAAASARIGFLVNQNVVSELTEQQYRNSPAYRSQYRQLLGVYAEKGDALTQQSSRFTIYEPNGDLHPNGTDGTYLLTHPIGLYDGRVTTIDIRDRLTVQRTNRWKDGQDGGISMEQLFQTAIAGKEITSVLQAKQELYNKYLQGQFAPYVDKGTFVPSTDALYQQYFDDGTVSKQEMSALGQSGATDDVCITHLKKDVPQRIRMFIWIEGQDPDCFKQAGIQEFALSIELAGSKQDQYG